jgi:hypothetical protein
MGFSSELGHDLEFAGENIWNQSQLDRFNVVLLTVRQVSFVKLPSREFRPLINQELGEFEEVILLFNSSLLWLVVAPRTYDNVQVVVFYFDPCPS